MKIKKICIVITTRGNYGKTKSIMKAIRQDPSMELKLIVGGSAVLPKYGDLRDVIESEGYPIDKTVTFLVEGENLTTMTQSAGLALMEMGRIYEDLKPDLVLVIADRFEALAIAMGAVYMNIPVAHLEGGEISGSIDESIRHAITKLSHIHFPATQAAADRIIRMGEDPASVFVTGTPSLDVLREMDLTNTDILFEAQRTMGVGSEIDFKGEYLIVLQHPVVTEYEYNLRNISETIAAVDELKYPTVWIWPNMDAGSDGISKGLRVYREKEKPQFIHFFKSLPINEYLCLLNNCICLAGNSSSGIRESAYMGIPVVNIGTRQNSRENGDNVVNSGYDRAEIKNAIRRQIEHGRYPSNHLYGDGKAGARIAEIMKKSNPRVQKRNHY